jgi:hypothetical protein
MFGGRDCMKTIRARSFDAIIGVGGARPWYDDKEIAHKLSWIGIKPHKFASRVQMGLRGPFMAFEHFKDLGEHGRLLEAPNLADHIYTKGARHIMNLSSKEQQEVEEILKLAWNEPPSKHLAKWDRLEKETPQRINDVSRRLKKFIDLQQRRARLTCPPCGP